MNVYYCEKAFHFCKGLFSYIEGPRFFHYLIRQLVVCNRHLHAFCMHFCLGVARNRTMRAYKPNNSQRKQAI